MPVPSTADPIDLAALYQEVTAELRATELCAAELRGQLNLLERLIREIQARQQPAAPAVLQGGNHDHATVHPA